jgi:hypothetical protein
VLIYGKGIICGLVPYHGDSLIFAENGSDGDRMPSWKSEEEMKEGLRVIDAIRSLIDYTEAERLVAARLALISVLDEVVNDLARKHRQAGLRTNIRIVGSGATKN